MEVEELFKRVLVRDKGSKKKGFLMYPSDLISILLRNGLYIYESKQKEVMKNLKETQIQTKNFYIKT